MPEALIAPGEDGRRTILAQANYLVTQGRSSDAEPLLATIVAQKDVVDPITLQALVLLARCRRLEQDYATAREAAMAALNVARAIGLPSGESVAFESLAMIESADAHIAAAGQYFLQSADLEQRVGNNAGAAA